MNKNIDHPETIAARAEGLRWWKSLTDEERVIYSEAHHGVERHPATLTGREIQEIHETAIS